MASIVKRLRPRIVVPICVGSNPTTRPIFHLKTMLNKIRSTICYKIVSVLGYLLIIFVLIHFLWMLPVIIPKMELAGLLLIPIYFLLIVFFNIAYILLGIGQFFEQKRIKQVSTNIFFDIGYVSGLIILIFIIFRIC